MEYPNYYFDGYNNTPQQEPKPPKRGIGGYVVTAIIFTIVRRAACHHIYAGGASIVYAKR